MQRVGAVLALCIAAGIGVSAGSVPALAQSPAAPTAAEETTVLLGDVILEGGFPELASTTEELVSLFRGRRVTADDL